MTSGQGDGTLCWTLQAGLCSESSAGRASALEPLLSTPGVERAVPATSADFEWLVCLLIASSLVPKCFLEMAGLGEVSLLLLQRTAQDQ